MRKGVIAILLLLAQPAFAGEKDKLYSSTLDVRTVLSFKVADSAAQKMLPEGWQVEPPNTGPSKGTNLSVVLVDQILAQDAEGKPVDAVRGAALVVPAKKQGMEKAIAMVIGGLFSPTSYAPGPYSNFVYAKADLDRKIHSDPAGTTSVEESWSFTTDSGDSVQVQVQYTRGVPGRANVEALVYSGAKPDFYRIYRYEQATDGCAAQQREQIVRKKSRSRPPVGNLLLYSMVRSNSSALLRSPGTRGRSSFRDRKPSIQERSPA
jgi:hypothetical protein